METKIEAESEKETVADKKSSETPESQNTVIPQSKPEAESSWQRLTPAILVSVSILLSSGIISATSFAKSNNMAPQIRNFYYQLPPSGPYMSNLAMPQNPMKMNQNRPDWSGANQQPNLRNDQKTKMNQPPQMMRPPAWVNQPPQMNRPNWARPTPPWIQNGAGQQPNLSNDQKAMMNQPPQMMRPPAWANQPPQMNRPNWARPTPPWVQHNSKQSSAKE